MQCSSASLSFYKSSASQFQMFLYLTCNFFYYWKRTAILINLANRIESKIMPATVFLINKQAINTCFCFLDIAWTNCFSKVCVTQMCSSTLFPKVNLTKIILCCNLYSVFRGNVYSRGRLFSVGTILICGFRTAVWLWSLFGLLDLGQELQNSTQSMKDSCEHHRMLNKWTRTAWN